jgi:hypothetical protein
MWVHTARRRTAWELSEAEMDRGVNYPKAFEVSTLLGFVPTTKFFEKYFNIG